MTIDQSRILVLNGASAEIGAAFGLVHRMELVAEGAGAGRGGAERLPMMLDEALRRVGWTPSSLGLIAVVVGPGSFTGLRASLAFAHGLAIGVGAALVGVTVGEALAPALHAMAGRADGDAEQLWCVSQARRDRVFIERPGAAGWGVEGAMLDALPEASPGHGGTVLLGGDAGALVADRLGAGGRAHRLSGLDRPSAVQIAAAGLLRLAGGLPPLAVQPLYVDPPEARLPAKPAIRV